jgi:7-carboxy-7-deazaguanine synthase
MIKNQQVQEPRNECSDPLEVQNIFPTIQGEGFFTGHPATFIRLAGCNLQCPLCDTDYTSKRRNVAVKHIVSACKVYGFRLVVITGGEPFRQDLSKLLETLVRNDFTVVVETNGTLPPPEDMTYLRNVVSSPAAGVYISCSPKTGYVHQKIQKYAFYLKYVVRFGSVDPVNGLPLHVLGLDLRSAKVWHPPQDYKQAIYIQPADEQEPTANELNLRTAIQSSLKHGYILTTQLHKTIGVE